MHSHILSLSLSLSLPLQLNNLSASLSPNCQTLRLMRRCVSVSSLLCCSLRNIVALLTGVWQEFNLVIFRAAWIETIQLASAHWCLNYHLCDGTNLVHFFPSLSCMCQNVNVVQYVCLLEYCWQHGGISYEPDGWTMYCSSRFQVTSDWSKLINIIIYWNSHNKLFYTAPCVSVYPKR